jgi:hypothetical protein
VSAAPAVLTTPATIDTISNNRRERMEASSEGERKLLILPGARSERCADPV